MASDMRATISILPINDNHQYFGTLPYGGCPLGDMNRRSETVLSSYCARNLATEVIRLLAQEIDTHPVDVGRKKIASYTKLFIFVIV